MNFDLIFIRFIHFIFLSNQIPIVNCLKAKNSLYKRMFTRFKSSKSSSKAQSNAPKSISNSKLIQQIRYPLKDANKTNQLHFKNNRNKHLTSTTETQSEKQNIYYTPVIKSTTLNNQNLFGLKNPSTKQKRTIDFFQTKRQKGLSAESSRSCISLKKNHFDLKNIQSPRKQQNPQKQNIYQSYDFITSFLENKKPNIKQISTKTSIKQIQEHGSPSQKRILNKSPIINYKSQTKQSTLQIVMKNMLLQLKQVRNQNLQLKNELIQIRSQQFYLLNRSKVKQMVIELEKQKQIRVKVQKQNQKLKSLNEKIKESYNEAKKQNIRFKRINADMKRTIVNLNEENKVLRERAWVKQQNSPNKQESSKFFNDVI